MTVRDSKALFDWLIDRERTINFLSERKYVMIIDTVVKLKESHRFRRNKQLGIDTLNELSTFIFNGKYAKVKNKEYILKNWLLYSPKRMALDLDITVKGVYYLKKKINEQLIKELGSDLATLVFDENFQEITTRLKLAQKRLNTDSALPQYINGIVTKKVIKEPHNMPMDGWLESNLKATLNGRNTIDAFIPELAFMKNYRKTEINKQINSLNPKLLDYLIQISASKKGNLELRNLLFKYLNDSH